ncbi:hypothetical protein Tco_1556035 [Tanacetum coccineum]
MADNRTMAEMLQAPIEGYEDAIVVPPINANNFELKHINPWSNAPGYHSAGAYFGGVTDWYLELRSCLRLLRLMLLVTYTVIWSSDNDVNPTWGISFMDAYESDPEHPEAAPQSPTGTTYTSFHALEIGYQCTI